MYFPGLRVLVPIILPRAINACLGKHNIQTIEILWSNPGFCDGCFIPGLSVALENDEQQS